MTPSCPTPRSSVLAGIEARHRELIHAVGGLDAFRDGVYGATEMFVDGFWHLLRAGVLKRAVYDFWALQQLIDQGHCDPQRLTPPVLDRFDELGVRAIRTKDFEILQHPGLFNDATRYDRGYLIAPDGTRVMANFAETEARTRSDEHTSELQSLLRTSYAVF